MKHHLEKVCRSGTNAVHHDQAVDKSFNTFLSISCDTLGDELDALEHYRHIEATNACKKHTSMSELYINVQMTIDVNGCQPLNISNNLWHHHSESHGCSRMAKLLDWNQYYAEDRITGEDLVSVRMSMRAANERDMHGHILGVIIVLITCSARSGFRNSVHLAQQCACSARRNFRLHTFISHM